jgi:hypothetical protein
MTNEYTLTENIWSNWFDNPQLNPCNDIKNEDDPLSVMHMHHPDFENYVEPPAREPLTHYVPPSEIAANAATAATNAPLAATAAPPAATAAPVAATAATNAPPAATNAPPAATNAPPAATAATNGPPAAGTLDGTAVKFIFTVFVTSCKATCKITIPIITVDVAVSTIRNKPPITHTVVRKAIKKFKNRKGNNNNKIYCPEESHYQCVVGVNPEPPISPTQFPPTM